MDLINSTRQSMSDMYHKILKAVVETNNLEAFGYFINDDNFIRIDFNSEDTKAIFRISNILELNIKMDVDGEFVELAIVTDDKTVIIDRDGQMG